MSALLKVCRFIDRLNAQIAHLAKWLVLLAIVISAGNAFMRKIFSVSSNAYLELQWYLFSAVFLLCAAYALLRGEHVRIDLVFGHLKRRTQVLIEVFGTLAFLLPFCVVTVYLVTPVVIAKFQSGETSPNVGGLLFWPAWALIPAGFTLLGLQGLSELIKRIAFLSGSGPDPSADYIKSPH